MPGSSSRSPAPLAVEPSPAPGSRPNYAIGIVNFRSYVDLARCLEGVKRQSLPPTRVLVVDNDPDLRELRRMREEHPEVVWTPRRNRGFSASANFIVDRLSKSALGEEFFLLVTPDVVLEAGFAESLLAEMRRFEDVALASGKLLRPSVTEIDSAGIVLPPYRRPRDRGSEERDRGQYDRTEFVFGASGAALMIRAAAIEDLCIEGELFDEDFFAYHEDTDLAWRANLLGWRVLYAPRARAIHTRQWRRARRFEIPAAIRRHSFKNHYLQLIKNEGRRDFLVNLPAIAAWEILRLGYALLRDQALLAAYLDAWKYSGRAWRKRRILQRRARERSGSRSPGRVDLARRVELANAAESADREASRP